jgi:hypothetical protein
MKVGARKWIVGAVAAGAAGVLLGLSPVAAAPGGDNGSGVATVLELLLNPTFGLEEIKNEVRTIETTVGAIDDKVTALGDRVEVEVGVNVIACESGGVQCSDDGSGHVMFEGANDSNHNPVMIVALVTINGEPVTGLTQDNFFIQSGTVPAGGTSLEFCPNGGTGCGGPPESLFNGDHNGHYMMFAHPGPLGENWSAGTYFSTLQVVLPDGQQVRRLIRIDIPAAP